MALMSGARPVGLPALAISGATGCGAELDTLYTIPPTSSTHSTPATAQARRSPDRLAGDPPTGVPQRWQNRAWGESSARQAVHAGPLRLAPQSLQKLPEAVLPQDGQVTVVMGEA